MDLSVLVIDDDITQLKLVEAIISKIDFLSCNLYTEQDSTKALDIFYKTQFDLVITDYNMVGYSGEDIINLVKEHNPNIPVAVITSVTNVNKVIDIMKTGVYDFILKPIKVKNIEMLLRKVYDITSLEKEINNLKHQIHHEFSIESIIGSSRGIREVIEIIGKCSEHSVNVLIRGESGTGKELVAHALHYTSLRKDKPFVIVNIAALSESLIDSELFGHVKGSFTGADRDRPGRFEEADGGTIFIDEIGDISLAIQVKLLRAIQFKEFQRVGDNVTHKSDVRILAATSRNLEEMMENGSFRKDLFYRLNVVSINVPPLRERREDIPELIDFFIKATNKEEEKTFSKEAMHSIITYDYPGNVRELANLVEHVLVFSRGNQITLKDLPQSFKQLEDSQLLINTLVSSYDEIMKNFETKLLLDSLEDSNWNQSKAARSLEISERRLRYRMERLSIKSPLK